MSDEFEINDALKKAVRLRVMLVAPSGAGKTESSLRLGVGMCSVVGGQPALIDTQDQAAAWYATKYKFGMVNLRPPHDPDRVLRAVQFAATKSRVVVVDTLSDEHEGEGGVLEMHESTLADLVAENEEKARRQNREPSDADKLSPQAWNRVKAARKRLIRGLRFVDAHIIFTVRAKERSKIFASKRRQDKSLPAAPRDEDGWVAVTDDDFLFECPIRMLMLPMSNGVPCWNPVAESERKAIRRPGQFEELLRRFEGKSLCEEMGAEMARWAMGDDAPKLVPEQPKVAPEQPTRKPGEILRDDIANQIDSVQSETQLTAIAAGIAACVESKKFGPKTAEWLHGKLDVKRLALIESGA